MQISSHFLIISAQIRPVLVAACWSISWEKLQSINVSRNHSGRWDRLNLHLNVTLLTLPFLRFPSFTSFNLPVQVSLNPNKQRWDMCMVKSVMNEVYIWNQADFLLKDVKSRPNPVTRPRDVRRSAGAPLRLPGEWRYIGLAERLLDCLQETWLPGLLESCKRWKVS